MKVLNCCILLLFPFLQTIALSAHARLLSGSAENKLAVIITIYGRKTPSPPPSPSSSPPTHQCTLGAATSSSLPPPPNALSSSSSSTPQQIEIKGSSYERTRTSPPPPPKAAPSHGELGNTSPCNRFLSMVTEDETIKMRSSPSIFSSTPQQIAIKGSSYERTRTSPPPPPKAAPSHGELGNTSPCNGFLSMVTEDETIKMKSSPSIFSSTPQQIAIKGSSYERTRTSPPPPPKAAPSHGEIGNTSPCNGFLSMVTEDETIRRRSSPSIFSGK